MPTFRIFGSCTPRNPLMEEFLECGDYQGLATYCEQEELRAEGGVAKPEVYGCLLGVYLVQNELDHAKLLWQRIPKAVKQSNGELGELWEVGKRLWCREFSGIYDLASNPAWPVHLSPLVSELIERVRRRVVCLVGKAYSVIRLKDLCNLLGQSEEQVRQVAESCGWELDGQSGVCRPTPCGVGTTGTQQLLLKEQESLARLTDIVSFLEN